MASISELPANARADLAARLKRIDDSKFLLKSRGFHWINEFPFNR